MASFHFVWNGRNAGVSDFDQWRNAFASQSPFHVIVAALGVADAVLSASARFPRIFLPLFSRPQRSQAVVGIHADFRPRIGFRSVCVDYFDSRCTVGSLRSANCDLRPSWSRCTWSAVLSPFRFLRFIPFIEETRRLTRWRFRGGSCRKWELNRDLQQTV